MHVQVERRLLKEDEYYGNEDQFIGFTKIAEMEWDHEAYAFNITGLWVKDNDFTLWMAHDSGCSCLIPWKNTTELERVFSLSQIDEHREKQRDEYSKGHPLGEWTQFRDTAKHALGSLQEEE